MGFVVQEFSTHLCSHVCRGRCQNSSDPLGIVCTLMKITSLHRFTLLWFQKQTNWASPLSRFIVYTISLRKAFAVDVYNVSWYLSDKFLEYEHMAAQAGGVYICVCVCLSVETSVLPKGLLSRAMPAHFLNTCHIVTGLHEGEKSQQMTRAELLTAGTRKLIAKRLQQYVALLATFCFWFLVVMNCR